MLQRVSFGRRLRRISQVLFVLCACISAFAPTLGRAESLAIHAAGEDIPLGRHFEVAVDKARAFTIDDVRAGALDHEFHKSAHAVPTFNGIKGAAWARVTIENAGAEIIQRQLVLNQIDYDHLDLFVVPPDGSMIHRRLSFGDEKRDIDRVGLQQVFNLALHPGTTRVWLRIDSSSVNFGAFLRTYDAQTEAVFLAAGLHIFTTSALLLVLIAAIAVWIGYGDGYVLLPFCLYIALAWVADFCGLGYGRLVFGDRIGSYQPYIGSIEFVAIALLWFVRRFLGLAEEAPAISRALVAFQVVLGLVFLSFVFAPFMTPTLRLISIMVFAVLTVWLIVHMGWRKRSVIFLSLGLVPLYFSGVVSDLILAGMTAQTFETQIVILVPQALSLILFALGIGVQISEKIQQTQLALEDSEAMLIEYNLKLEEMVEHRTRHLVEAQSKLATLATTDALTGCTNRRHFLEIADDRIALAHRNNSPLSLLLVDIDHFKRINDTYGHPAGDEVLREFGRILSSNTRITDTIGRMGGEEFGILVPDTGSEGAMVLAEKLLETVNTAAVTSGEHKIQMAVSIGVTTLVPGENFDAFYARADHALYDAKNNGRNRASLAA